MRCLTLLITGAFTLSLSILILNSQCVEGARDVRVLSLTPIALLWLQKVSNSVWVIWKGCFFQFYRRDPNSRSFRNKDIIFGTQILLTSLAPSSYWEFSMSTLKLNVKRAPEMSTIYRFQWLFMSPTSWNCDRFESGSSIFIFLSLAQ